MAGTKETLCTRCIHREVCSLKTDFMEAQKSVDNVYIIQSCDAGMIYMRDIKYIKPVELICIHYEKKSEVTNR